MSAKKLVAVGHYSHDTLIHPGHTSHKLGGSVSYISAILEPLRVDYEIISKVGRDFRYGPELTRVPQVSLTAPTTNFISDFTQGERIGRVGARCEDILPTDIQGQWEVALACGIVGELPPATLLALADRSKFLVCDIQGLIRSTQPDGQVTHTHFDETVFKPLLPKISFLKASREESKFIDVQAARQVTRIIITEGSEGCTLLSSGSELHMPAFETAEIDPTGAGDCFLAGFAVGLLKGRAISECLKFGNFCGSLAIGQIGLPRLESGRFAERNWL